MTWKMAVRTLLSESLRPSRLRRSPHAWRGARACGVARPAAMPRRRRGCGAPAGARAAAAQRPAPAQHRRAAAAPRALLAALALCALLPATHARQPQMLSPLLGISREGTTVTFRAAQPVAWQVLQDSAGGAYDTLERTTTSLTLRAGHAGGAKYTVVALLDAAACSTVGAEAASPGVKCSYKATWHIMWPWQVRRRRHRRAGGAPSRARAPRRCGRVRGAPRGALRSRPQAAAARSRSRRRARAAGARAQPAGHLRRHAANVLADALPAHQVLPLARVRCGEGSPRHAAAGDRRAPSARERAGVSGAGRARGGRGGGARAAAARAQPQT
jgi:hypothetical protein